MALPDKTAALAAWNNGPGPGPGGIAAALLALELAYEERIAALAGETMRANQTPLTGAHFFWGAGLPGAPALDRAFARMASAIKGIAQHFACPRADLVSLCQADGIYEEFAGRLGRDIDSYSHHGNEYSATGRDAWIAPVRYSQAMVEHGAHSIAPCPRRGHAFDDAASRGIFGTFFADCRYWLRKFRYRDISSCCYARTRHVSHSDTEDPDSGYLDTDSGPFRFPLSVLNREVAKMRPAQSAGPGGDPPAHGVEQYTETDATEYEWSVLNNPSPLACVPILAVYSRGRSPVAYDWPGREVFAELEETSLVNLDYNGDGLNYDDYELESWRAAYVGNHLGATRRVLREDYAYSGYYNELVRTISRSRLPAGRGAVQARVDETETETLRGPAQSVPSCFVADASLPSATEMAELAGHGRREVRWLWQFPSLPAWPSGFPSAPKRTFPSSWWTSGAATRQGSYDLYIIGDYAGSYDFN